MHIHVFLRQNNTWRSIIWFWHLTFWLILFFQQNLFISFNKRQNTSMLNVDSTKAAESQLCLNTEHLRQIGKILKQQVLEYGNERFASSFQYLTVWCALDTFCRGGRRSCRCHVFYHILYKTVLRFDTKPFSKIFRHVRALKSYCEHYYNITWAGIMLLQRYTKTPLPSYAEKWIMVQSGPPKSPKFSLFFLSEFRRTCHSTA